jgi:hypothetical protein
MALIKISKENTRKNSRAANQISSKSRMKYWKKWEPC